MDASHTGSSAASEAPTTGEHRMGTTTVGVCYNGGVILGDSRTSTGMYVANRASDKITQLKDNVYVCRPGSDTDLMKLRTNGLPPYLPQMDDMFQGNTVINDVSSDEEAGEEEDDLTPMSIGNKRASSSSTTASSPSKRSKSLAVRSINSLMTTYNEIARERLQLQKEMHRENKQMQENIRMELSWKIAECTRIAEQEMGLSADTPTLLDGLFYLSKSESYMDLFLSSTSEAVRMRIIEKLAHNNAPVQNYGYASTRKELLTQLKNEEDELLSELMADEEEDEFILGMYQYALYIDKYLTRAEYRVSKVTGLEWVHAKLSNEKASYNMFRMTPTMFISLHDLLVEKYGLKSTTKSSSFEALGMFLWMVGAPESVRQAEDRFERSLGTVSKMFNKVLNCLVKLAADIIKPVDPEFKTLNPRLRNPKFYPYFKNCIGAIDGTHVQCVVPNDMFVQHMCRKGITTQNVMACCDFDMRFTFVIAGWPGSVHDMRVFNDSTTTYNVVFPHPPQGKYYLVDSGYANRQGYLAPYKGTKYHLQEFQDAHKPEGKEEIFNYTHSSLRNVIERSFGVLKMKWRILQKIPPYAHEKQSRIIVACMALHNFMRSSGIPDKHFHRCDTNENYMPRQAYENQPTPEVVDDVSNVMSVLRDSLAYALANRS